MTVLCQRYRRAIWGVISVLAIQAVFGIGISAASKIALAQDLITLHRLEARSAPEPGQNNVDSTPAINLDALALDHSPELQAKLQTLLGRPIDKALLADIRAAITAQYAANGHPFVDIGFPPQDVTDGTLVVLVAEYRVGDVRVVGNRYVPDAVIIAASALTPGQTIDKPELGKHLALISQPPFLLVTPEFHAGSVPGQTEAILHAQDRFPLMATLGYADNGAKATGWDRWTLGTTWGNSVYLPFVASYNYSASDDVFAPRPAEDGVLPHPNFFSHRGSVALPLDDGARLSVSAAYTQQSPSIGPSLGSLGVTHEVDMDFTRPLHSGLAAWLDGAAEEAGVGYSYKRTNNNLSFGGLLVQSAYTDISEFLLHYSLSLTNALGPIQATETLTLSPGGMTRGNSDGAFQPSGTAQSGTPGASARYAYNRVVLTQIVPVTTDLGLVLRASGQVSTTTLLASEQLSIAGVDAVRGYQEFGEAGSDGVVLSAELRGPRFNPWWGAWRGGTDDSAQLHVFVDSGKAWNPHASMIAPGEQTTLSAGVGGNMQIASTLNVRLEQGWEILRSTRQGAGGAFLHAAVTATW